MLNGFEEPITYIFGGAERGSMTTAEARELVLSESVKEGGVIVALRMGDDPGAERMQQLLSALSTLFDDLRGAKTIDRELAYALHVLAVYSDMQVSSWSRQGHVWRKELVEDEVLALGLAVESIFAGEWAKLHAEPETRGR